MADLRHAIDIDADPGNVAALVRDGHGFRRWWAEDVETSGGHVALGFFNRNTVYRLRRTDAVSAGRIEWQCETGDEWKDTTLIFDIRPGGRGCTLEFIHANWRAETAYFVRCNTTWGELMFRLKAAAEGKDVGPLFRIDALAY
jgi:hypothetical protein